MAFERLTCDASRPYQLAGGLLAIWLPRGRGRDDRSQGLVAAADVCANPRCACTNVQLAAMLVDDRLVWAKRTRDKIQTTWRATTDPRPEASYESLTLDMRTGQVNAYGGGAVPDEMARYFRDPVPSWLLDDLFADWMIPRGPVEGWLENALRDWEPGVMLSHMLVYPGARPEEFVRDGKTYGVDVVFCVKRGCACVASRFVVFEVDGTTWRQIASAELGDDMMPRDLDGAIVHHGTLISLYLDWRARAGNAEARFAELRARVNARGAELHAAWEARRLAARAAEPFVAARATPLLGSALAPRASGASAVKPGRNDPCPCGSGKKYKRCCAA